jgi:hypothetical protein
LIIALFGPDGSGKTSIVRGFKGTHKVVAIRGTHTLASFIARLLQHFALFRGSANPYFGIRIPGKMCQLWYALEFVSVLPHIIYKFILLPKFQLVMAERSIPDFIVWIMTTLRFRKRFSVSSLPWIFLLKLCNKQDQMIYVKASLDTLIARRTPQAELIRIQLPIYDTIAKLVGAYIIDTTHKTAQDSLNEIAQLTGNRRNKMHKSESPKIRW